MSIIPPSPNLPDIPQVDLRRENCFLCGHHEIREFSFKGASLTDLPLVCSPCRAERTGAIQMVMPSALDPSVLSQRIDPYREKPPAVMSGAIQVALDVWEKALQDTAHSAKVLMRILTDRPDEEAVIHALMGGPLISNLESARPGTLVLTGIAPELARRIATEVPLAEGPALSPAHETEIRLLVAKRRDQATEQRALRAAKRRAQPPAPLPADGSHGDAP